MNRRFALRRTLAGVGAAALAPLAARVGPSLQRATDSVATVPIWFEKGGKEVAHTMAIKNLANPNFAAVPRMIWINSLSYGRMYVDRFKEIVVSGDFVMFTSAAIERATKAGGGR